MKRILIVGISSFIGSTLARYLRKFYRVFGTYDSYRPRIDRVGSSRLHLEPQAPIDALVNNFRPDVILYCAGITNEIECHRDPAKALFINSDSPASFARALRFNSGRLIYLSSSKVFSGEKGNYMESDKPDADGVYGKSKLRGEEFVGTYENTFIVRLGTLFGLGSLGQNSMFNRILGGFWEQKEIQLIQDEYRSFLSVKELSKIIGILMDADREYAGMYHLGLPEKTSYYSFATLVAGTFGLPAHLLNPISSAEFTRRISPQGGGRGKDLTLDGARFSTTFSYKFEPLDGAVAELKIDLESGRT